MFNLGTQELLILGLIGLLFLALVLYFIMRDRGRGED
jgi:hypothetical protein